jgi:hypothetical protein
MTAADNGAPELQEYTPEGVPGIFTGLSWTPPREGLSYEPWERLGNVLREYRYRTEWDKDRALWWLADWLAFGEDYFGEKYAQAFDGTAFSREGLHNIAYIGNNIAPERRWDGLGFWKHYEVASLSDRDQETALSEAVELGYSRDALRERVADIKGRSKPASSSGIRPEPAERVSSTAPDSSESGQEGPGSDGVTATRIDTPEPTRILPTGLTACPCCAGAGFLADPAAEEALWMLKEGGFYD